MDWLEKDTEKYVGSDAKLSYELIRQTCKSYVCEKWLQFHMKHAKIKAFLTSHAKLYKTIYFTSYVLNYNSYASVETRVESFSHEIVDV